MCAKITTKVDARTSDPSFVPQSPSTEGTLVSIKTAVEVIDNAILGNEMQVDIVSMPAISVTLDEATSGVLIYGNTVKDGSGTSYVPLLDTSGHLQVDFLNTSIAVTGTFWQTTQPVSGTFWQTTQPVSIASAQVASGAFASGAIAVGAIVDGADVTQGAKADARSVATDTTPITIMSVLKEISYMAQNPASHGPGTPVVDSYTHLAINLSAGANQVLVSSAANKQIWVYGVGFTVDAAGSVSFQDEDDTAITGVMLFATNSGLAMSPSGNFAMPIWKLATNKDLEVDIVTSAIDGWLDYAIISV